MLRALLLSCSFIAIAGCATEADASPFKICPNGQRIYRALRCSTTFPTSAPRRRPVPTPTPAPVPTQVCYDSSIIPASEVCPVAPPPPPPPPLPTPSFSVADVTVNENSGNATVLISKTGANGSASTIHYATAHGTATPGVDYTSISGDLVVSNGSSLVSVSVPIIDDGTVEATEVFNLTISPVANAVLGDANGVITIIDNDFVTPPPPSPPPPPPPPSPGPNPTTFPAPVIASNFDVPSTLKASWGTGAIPPSSSPDVLGAFRFICGGDGPNKKDDPVLYPAQPGASHPHKFYGNKGADASSTYTSFRTTGGSTCGGVNTTSPNRSGYWEPEMLDGKGNYVLPDFIIIYYKRRPASDPKCTLGNPQAQGDCVSIPLALRFIYGWDPTGMNSAPTGDAWFNCQGPTAVAGHYLTIAAVAANCPAGQGNQLGSIIEAPTCWNGVDLDVADHRSHVAYPSYGTWGYLKCDAAHPKVIPQFTQGTWYSVKAGDDPTLWSLSSDAMAPTQPKGYTMHGDYFNAWDDGVLKMWTDNCINLKLNCSGGDLGNGLQIKGADQPSYGWLANPHLIPVLP